jgi:hypothetical protein
MRQQTNKPIPMAVRPKAWVCGHSLAGIGGSNPTGGMDVLSLVSCMLSGREVSASDRSLDMPMDGTSNPCFLIQYNQ